MEEHCDVIILAAGASTRLGKPKQLLLFKESTFLKHCIEITLVSLARRVIVVLGANAALMPPPVKNDKLTFIINDQWQEGMASSIRCGLQHLLKQAPAPQNVLFMVCDQPYITTDLLDKLITLQRVSGSKIVASQYAETTGTPVVFSKALFPELLQLTGDAGAKKLMMQKKENVISVSFPLGDIDIDTAADYENLRKKIITKNDH